jgi:hypothetical protein
MTNKVWYRHRGQLEVDVIADHTDALRRAAAIITDQVGSELEFVGIEHASGDISDRRTLDKYIRGYRARGLDEVPAVCPKYYVEVRAPAGIGGSVTSDWVRYAIEQTRVRADQRALEAVGVFGTGRVRVTPVTTRPAVKV